jgi:hypothetical protein
MRKSRLGQNRLAANDLSAFHLTRFEDVQLDPYSALNTLGSRFQRIVQLARRAKAPAMLVTAHSVVGSPPTTPRSVGSKLVRETRQSQIVLS